ncbi:unnamed protein product, partial [Ectocarpus sp. 12 AP-2014]
MGDTTCACRRERTLLIAQAQTLNKKGTDLWQGSLRYFPHPHRGTESKKLLHPERTMCKQINTCIRRINKLHVLYPSREPHSEGCLEYSSTMHSGKLCRPRGAATDPPRREIIIPPGRAAERPRRSFVEPARRRLPRQRQRQQVRKKKTAVLLLLLLPSPSFLPP